jgi:hypothetical protein
MATITHLLDEMAAASILGRTELAWRTRNLGDEITQGRRGKAGTATTRDAAVLLIASMSTAPAPRLREAVRRVGGKTIRCDVKFPYAPGPGAGKPIEFQISEAGASFEKVLVQIIDLRRHRDVHTAGLAGNFSKIGIREAMDSEWPWIEMFDPNRVMRLHMNDQINGRFVFGDLKAYAMTSDAGLVRETAIGTTALYRVSTALGLEWKQAAPEHSMR